MTLSNRFSGELMTCHICGKQQLSHPRVMTNWRAIELPDSKPPVIRYFCPDEFPKDGATAKEYEAAYLRALKSMGISK